MRLVETDAKCAAVQALVVATQMNGRPVNTFDAPQENWRAVTEAGRLVINDVRYADQYPNSFLDIWYPDQDQHKRRPVILNFHGGGFIFGSKKMGDPLALKSSDGDAYIDGLVNLGYIFVNADYALAPEYRFPTQIVQVDQALRFILDHAEEYGFDVTNITLTGGSAGADMTEIYAMAVSDPAYAEKLGFKPVLGTDGLRCVIINESALQMDCNAKDENMCAMLQTWLGAEDPVDSEPSRLADVSAHITGTYPPAFLIASNSQDFFRAEAYAMAKVLGEQGLPYELFYVEPSVASLDHGFVSQCQENEYAADCYQKMIAFLQKYTA